MPSFAPSFLPPTPPHSPPLPPSSPPPPPRPSGGLVSRFSVSQVRSDMENRMAQAQAVAVREALKETNVQTSSKEVS